MKTEGKAEGLQAVQASAAQEQAGTAWRIDEAGWGVGIARSDCPNCDARPDGTEINLLVIHNISLPPQVYGGRFVEDLFANRLDCDAHPYFDQLRGLKVSAHFFIRRDGSVVQFVPTTQRAWHAGLSNFKGRERCNDRLPRFLRRAIPDAGGGDCCAACAPSDYRCTRPRAHRAWPQD